MVLSIYFSPLRKVSEKTIFVGIDRFCFAFGVSYVMIFTEMFLHRSSMFADVFAGSALVFSPHGQMRNAIGFDRRWNIVWISNV